ncbi:hypothetical protein F2P81_023646 [Scophthalmus maximus]|uniref:Uncharacterized protein n=1 Tax=Scophthalmus maximus TaxID=52904 RepID=A0A6A4S2T4_SCOMX|nr:hypothetical protein F2P81_023646 [Scophthalmus maximus]
MMWIDPPEFHRFENRTEGAGPAGPLPAFLPDQESGEPDVEDWELGSGSSLLHLLHSFPADSPFVTETPGKPVNCTQRFWLPPSSAVCWENIAGPEEFAKCRLLVLQNRASLQAVSTSSGVEEGGFSYDHLAREEIQGVRSDHLSVVETMQTMEKVFVSLGEKRREGTEQGILTRYDTDNHGPLTHQVVLKRSALSFTEAECKAIPSCGARPKLLFVSMRVHLSNTRDTIDVREHMADHLERQLSILEKTLLNVQLRLNKLIQQ